MTIGWPDLHMSMFLRPLRPHPSACTGLAFLVLALGLALSSSRADDQPSRPDLTDKDRARVAKVTAPTTAFDEAEAFEAMAGGAGTSRHSPNADAFSQFCENITFAEEQDFKLGNALFRKLWVSSPSSTQASDGLGPLFNARACQSCHLKDGRGHPPEADRDATSMFLRLARPARTAEEQARLDALDIVSFPDPVYGAQLQDQAVPGLAAEGRMVISYEERRVVLAGGKTVSLRKPQYSVSDLAYGPLDPQTTLSPRIANPMTGLGLIEAIAPQDIRSHADPDDKDADGISGRAARARDHRTGEIVLGRFGWKAQNGSVRDQSASAFAGDIGISTPDTARHWGDCTTLQTACTSLPAGAQPRLGSTGSGACPGDLLRRKPGSADPARCLKPGRAARQAAVLSKWLHCLPYTQIRDAARCRQQGPGLPIDLALFRFPAA